MRIAIVSDAWAPQINGVVRTLTRVRDWLRVTGHAVEVFGPERFPSIPCPTYPEIPLALVGAGAIGRELTAFDPDAIHIATEGPLGRAARRWCLRHGLHFTTAYHTRFPEYLRLRLPIPLDLSYAVLRRFHSPARCTLVPTPSLLAELERRGFAHLQLWTRGVDTELFRPLGKRALALPRPIFLYFGRVAVEKNIEAFLELGLPGSKVVIGDGPARGALERRYPQAHFLGAWYGEALARRVSAADVVVFPSLTDTFGLVLLEAMACGVPVAAFPVTGPRDLVEEGGNGALDDDLERAALRALDVDPADCRGFALAHSWEASCSQLLASLVPANGRPPEETIADPARFDARTGDRP